MVLFNRAEFNPSLNMKNTKREKGVAGLTILMSVIAVLFVIGLLITIFALMGSDLQSSVGTDTSTTKLNETLATVTETGERLSTAYGLRDVDCTVSIVVNATSGLTIASGNYTESDCTVYFATGGTLQYNNTNWNVSYAYTYVANNTATDTLAETTTSIAEASDWFDIIVVITIMVVLILLVVIIIKSIQSSGLIQNQIGV